MEDSIQRAVGRVIRSIREDLAEEHTVDGMARTAMFSKFHFTRIFQRTTGISPGRFLMVMRLHRAKQLLLSTSLSVTEITHEVGYASVGTFSSRFSSSVGVSPSTFRRLGGVTPQVPVDLRPTVQPPVTAIRGTVHAPESDHNAERTVFIGLFRDPVPLGRPASCTVLERPGPYRLESPPPGQWYVLAYSRLREEQNYWRPTFEDQDALIGAHGPLTICRRPGSTEVDLHLRRITPLDPPILLALPIR
ncbi:helix-turn-helix transcriptional regulator [Micromonospora sp. NPDC047527]|uniref:helix-turn-helix transcriptional regulator n=1 Tax=unclassified Micromonospora TaxID=2617518 RepID=UPI0033DC2533